MPIFNLMKKNIRILIVEDSLFLREMICHIFAESDIQVVGLASSAEEALSKIEALKPDLALVDLVLPGQNGIVLIKKIHYFYPEIKVIACSSLKHEHFVMESERAGAVDFLRKPFKSHEIKDAIFSAAREQKQEPEIKAA